MLSRKEEERLVNDTRDKNLPFGKNFNLVNLCDDTGCLNSLLPEDYTVPEQGKIPITFITEDNFCLLLES